MHGGGQEFESPRLHHHLSGPSATDASKEHSGFGIGPCFWQGPAAKPESFPGTGGIAPEQLKSDGNCIILVQLGRAALRNG